MWRGRGPARGQLPQRPQGRHVRLPGWCGGVEVEVVCVCVFGVGTFCPRGLGASVESASTARASLAGGQPVEAFPGLDAAAAPCSGTRVFCGSCLSLLY